MPAAGTSPLPIDRPALLAALRARMARLEAPGITDRAEVPLSDGLPGLARAALHELLAETLGCGAVLAKGVTFLTLEDGHGIANLVVFPDRVRRFQAALLTGRLLLAEGRLQRDTTAEVPILHLVGHQLEDWSAMLDGLADGDARWADRGLGHADEVRRPEPGSAHPRVGRSRDFR